MSETARDSFIEILINWDRSKYIMGPLIELRYMSGELFDETIADYNFVKYGHRWIQARHHTCAYGFKKIKIIYKNESFNHLCDALEAIPVEEFTTKTNLTIVILDEPDDMSIRLGNFFEVFSKHMDSFFSIHSISKKRHSL